ncbi:MAG TPA: ATP-binding protein [Gammaproteobacteria bacterium]|jgi:hypothetical protein
MNTKWTEIKPAVKEVKEFFEIACDFGDPLEVLREAISNSFDACANKVDVTFSVVELHGQQTLKIEMSDDGDGMSYEELEKKFWDLGNSNRDPKDETVIGEKGHGTKIYLRSSRIEVTTNHKSGSFRSECDNPFADLAKGNMHKPKIQEIGEKTERTGTKVILLGYNNNEMSRFTQEIVRDYLYWFTKLGSFEREFDGKKPRKFTVNLKALDADAPEPLEFGHRFGKIADNIDALFKTNSSDAADWFVKKYVWAGVALDKYPHIRCDVVIYVEGDKAKRVYNKMLRSTGPAKKGSYRVSDRYGIWLAKDFIPVEMKNEWVKGFGTGSNSVTLLHGFVNCQEFRLGANRGAIANARPEMMAEIQKILEEKIQEVDVDITEKGIFMLFQWQHEEKNKAVEAADYEKRSKDIKNRKYALVKHEEFGEIKLWWPNNESELYGLITKLEVLYPDLLPFEILDYNTTRGIDVIGRARTKVPVSESELKYVELKNYLGKEFNHSFANLGWVLCWDFSDDIKNETEISSFAEAKWKILFHENKGVRNYLLDNPGVKVSKIEVIRLKEYMEQKLGIKY